MPTISDIKKTKNSVNPLCCFSQLQSAGQSYRPGGRSQEFATKLAFEANLAENTKLTEIPLCPLCPLWLFSNPFILSNSFESLCLCALMPLWICTFSSTNVEDSLQISLFMQNKPNVKDAQINVNSYMKSKYEKLDTWLSGKNKPNSNPIKPNPQKAKMNVNLTLTKDYRKKDDFAVRINKPNSNPISVKPKMNVKLYFIEDYENETTFRPQNSNPIQTQFSSRNAKYALSTSPFLLEDL